MEASQFMTVDYVVLGIIGLSTLFAFIRGFIGSLFSLTGWILSIYLAYHFYPDVKPYLEPKVKNQIALLLAGHSLLLMGFLIFFGVFNLLATKAVKGMTSGIIDRILGAGFGALRGAIIVSFFFFIVMSTLSIFHGFEKDSGDADDKIKVALKKTDKSKDKSDADDKIAPKWLKDSKSYPYLKEGRDILKDFIPDTFNQRIQVAINDLTDKTPDEGFIETAMYKLAKTLTPKQQKELAAEGNQDLTNMTIEEAEQKKLSDLLRMYRENLADGKVKDDSTITDTDIKRIENILKNSDSIKVDTEKTVAPEVTVEEVTAD